MNSKQSNPMPTVDQLVLQTRAAHVYLDAMPGLTDEARRQQNRSQAERVLGDLERCLADPDCAEPVRARIEALHDALRERIVGIAG